VKWSIPGALIVVALVLGGFYALRHGDSMPVIEVVEQPTTNDTNRWGPWLRNGHWAPVEKGTTAMLFHCGEATICRGSILIEERRTGRVLGAGNYDMRPGTDTRVRVRVGHLPRRTKVRLTMREDSGAIGWPELTLRRRD
jgi:hypothetical protein